MFNNRIQILLILSLLLLFVFASVLYTNNLSLDEAKLDQQDVQRKLQLRNRQAYDQMTEAALLVNEYEKSLTNATENYRLINANYRAGLATITDLLTAQTTQLKAQNELTDARIQLLVTTRRYYDLINTK